MILVMCFEAVAVISTEVSAGPAVGIEILGNDMDEVKCELSMMVTLASELAVQTFGMVETASLEEEQV